MIESAGPWSRRARFPVNVATILVAAGRGIRMGGPTAKAFVSLGGQPLVLHSLRTLIRVPDTRSLILVVGANQVERATAMLTTHGPWPVQVRVVPGGAERQHSVAAGLAAIDADVEMVIVHDAARPFVSLACVEACVTAARTTGAAIAALPVHDTVKVVDGAAVQQTLDRRRIWLAQTPQVFRTAVLRAAYAHAPCDGEAATDDAALVERCGETVGVVLGEPDNRKITTPDDLRWAERHLAAQRDSAARDH